MRTLKVLLFFVLFFLFGATASHARSWTIDEFDSKINISKNSSIQVVETIKLRFEGEYNGIYRTIPVKYTGSYGSRYNLRLKIAGVTDENGRPLKYTAKKSGNYREIKVWVPGAADTVKTVVISYTVMGALNFFTTHDELYWNVTGNEWPVGIANAKASVIFPVKTDPGEIKYTAYTGPYGSAAKDYRAGLINGGEINFQTTASLGFREGLTIVCGWPKGVVSPIPSYKKFLWFIADNWYLFIPLFVLIFMTMLWHKIGKDPLRGRSVMPQYDPPDKLTPAEVGTVIDEKVDMRDISATVVDLAVKGYLKIKEEEEKGLIFTKKDYLFTLIKAGFIQDASLKKHEKEILKGIFGSGSSKKLSALQNKFYTVIPTIKDSLYDRTASGGYFNTRPDRIRMFYIGAAIVFAAAGFCTIPLAGEPNLLLIFSLVLSGGVIAIFSPLMPRKTKKGAEALWHIKGFEEYLSRAEKERLKLDTPETFEKLLPYAMALGVAEQWASAFKDIYKNPPGWYEGSYGSAFNSMIFINNLNALTHSASSTFTSAPRSSSGASGGHSGFGGGGFSGGGFGGGGGRAW